jgi:hypothetical protein
LFDNAAAQFGACQRASKTQRMPCAHSGRRTINGEKWVVKKQHRQEQAKSRSPGKVPVYSMELAALPHRFFSSISLLFNDS